MVSLSGMSLSFANLFDCRLSELATGTGEVVATSLRLVAGGLPPSCIVWRCYKDIMR